MNTWKISIKNIKANPLYTALSIFMLSLSITLLLGIQQIESSFKNQISSNLNNIDLVIGAKGSPLQLVLSSVLHIDNPTGNIPYQEAKKISKNRMVKRAVPISYGDNFKGYRIVGTNNSFFKIYNAALKKGQNINHAMEVVLGNTVANKLNLTIGSTFFSSHGLTENSLDVHQKMFTVVGILKPTKKVIDRLIVTNLESIWEVHNHEEDHHHHHEEHHSENEQEHETLTHENTLDDNEHHNKNVEKKEITSLLISFKNPMALLTIPRKINKETQMQAAIPKFELDKLQEYTGVGLKTIKLIAYLILIISGLTIFTSLYKMIKERAYDLALLRTYGASHIQLIKMIAYESFMIVSVAFIVGFLIEQIGLFYLLSILESSHQQNILQPLSLIEIFKIGVLVIGIILASTLLAIYPILKMNISTILSDEK